MTDLLYVATMAPDMREALSRFDVLDGRGLGADDLIELVSGRDVRAVFTDGGTGLDSSVIEALENLAIISNNGVGYDAVDATLCAGRGVVVTHTPDVLNDEVANTALALLLAVDRRIVAYDRYIRDGRWAREGAPPPTRSLKDRTVGIVGFGRIGAEIARKLQVFGCAIHYHARNPRDVAYTYHATPMALAEACDVAILITPGGASTRHLADGRVSARAGTGGNAGERRARIGGRRGRAYRGFAVRGIGRSGAGCLRTRTRSACGTWWRWRNVVLAPHIGSATVETRAAMGKLAVDNLTSFFKHGTVLTPVPECADIAVR